MILVVGATGLLGTEICRRLALSGKRVRALVRSTSPAEKTAILRALGVELAEGDLKQQDTLNAACAGVRAVISTASATLSRGSGDSIEAVDRQGQINLIDATRAAGVKHFVLVSAHFRPDIEFPLQAAKQAVEAHLRTAGITWTVLQPAMFMEIWLSPALGFDYHAGRVVVYGSGNNAVTYISYKDVATFAILSLENQRAHNATLALGGPRPVTQVRAIRVFESMVGRTFARQYVSEEELRAQFQAASDPLQKSFAGLKLLYALGDIIDMRELADYFGIELTGVRDYAHDVFGWRRQSTAIPE
jgi:uncharacterized protein YbjT (DUF2867 family)